MVEYGCGAPFSWVNSISISSAALIMCARQWDLCPAFLLLLSRYVHAEIVPVYLCKICDECWCSAVDFLGGISAAFLDTGSREAAKMPPRKSGKRVI